MANHEEIDRLKRRLQWEGGGPLTDLSSQALDGLAIRVRTLVFWVREMGFAAGKWGPGRAKR